MIPPARHTPPPGGPSRVIQGSFPGGRPRLLQLRAAPAPAQPARPAPPPFRPTTTAARPGTSLQPRPMPGRPGMPTPNPQPPHPGAAPPMQARPMPGRLPSPMPKAQAHRPAALQPSGPGGAFALPPSFRLRPFGSGQRLPEAVQRKMEGALGADFSGVRVHVGPEAGSIGASAFTLGSDLYFAPGQYNPHSRQGQQLLGHELTHVVQQRAGRVRNPNGTGLAVVQDAALEAEAERMGILVASAEVAGRAISGANPRAVQPRGPAREAGRGGRASTAKNQSMQLFTYNKKKFKFQFKDEQFESLSKEIAEYLANYTSYKLIKLEPASIISRLRKYCSAYPDRDFTLKEISEYIYDDLVRQGVGCDASAQHLFSNLEGIADLASNGKSAVKAKDKFVTYYRGMRIIELIKILGIEDHGLQYIIKCMPKMGEDFKKSITSEDLKHMGTHVGDYKQALHYFNWYFDETVNVYGAVMLEFTLEWSKLISPESIALPSQPGRKYDSLRKAFASGRDGSQDDYQKIGKNNSEGTHNTLLGLKSEERGSEYSIAISGGATGLFYRLIQSIKIVDRRFKKGAARTASQSHQDASNIGPSGISGPPPSASNPAALHASSGASIGDYDEEEAIARRVGMNSIRENKGVIQLEKQGFKVLETSQDRMNCLLHSVKINSNSMVTQNHVNDVRNFLIENGHSKEGSLLEYSTGHLGGSSKDAGNVALEELAKRIERGFTVIMYAVDDATGAIQGPLPTPIGGGGFPCYILHMGAHFSAMTKN